MEHTIDCSWTGQMAFEAHVDGHSILFDADEASGGKGEAARPKPVVLTALASCTGMDVVALLNKMRVAFDKFDIQVSGELTEEHPKTYRKIHLVYRLWGQDIALDKVEKAVSLSQEKYCGVSAMLRHSAEISYEIRLNP